MILLLQMTISLVLLFNVGLCEERYLGMIDELIPKYRLGNAKNEDIIVNTGETIELVCRGSDPGVIVWMFPRKSKPEEVMNQTTVVTYEVTLSGSGTYYTSKLIVPNITSEDTGEYECRCGGLLDDMMHVFKRHMGDGLVSRRKIYAYVTDPEELFQGNASSIKKPITGWSRSYTYLPCAVNDPNTTVELIREKGYGRMSVIHMTGKKYSYFPQAGFKIDGLSIRDIGAYNCRATDGDLVETREFYLHVNQGRPLILKPVLRTDSEFIGVGLPATFKCQVLAGKHQMTAITWWKQVGDNEPIKLTGDDRIHIEKVSLSSSLCSGERPMCSFLRRSSVFPTGYSLYVKWTGKLRINKAEQTDAGSYYCKAASSGKVMQSNTVELKVPAVSVHGEDNEDMASLPRYNVLFTKQV